MILSLQFHQKNIYICLCCDFSVAALVISGEGKIETVFSSRYQHSAQQPGNIWMRFSFLHFFIVRHFLQVVDNSKFWQESIIELTIFSKSSSSSLVFLIHIVCKYVLFIYSLHSYASLPLTSSCPTTAEANLANLDVKSTELSDIMDNN